MQQQMQGQPIIIVDADGVEHEFPAGMDPKRAAEIVRQKAGSSATPPKLTPQSVFGPVGQWLQANVQPKLEQAAQNVKAASRQDPGTGPLDIDRSLRHLAGNVLGGGINALAHPIQNAEFLAPVALELARAFNPVSRGMAAMSLLRGVPAAGPMARSAVAVGQSAERAALAGGAGAGVAAADANEPVLPAMGWGALRQGAGDLAVGGSINLLGGSARGIGRALGYKAGNIGEKDLASLYLAEKPEHIPTQEWLDAFNPKRAKTVVKDVMLERAPGSVFGDEYFEFLRQQAVGQRGARRAMIDSTKDVDPVSGETRDLGQYAVNLSDIPRAAYGVGAARGGPNAAFRPGADRAAAQGVGDEFLAGRTGVGIEDQSAIQRLVKSLDEAKAAPPKSTGILDAQGAPLLRFDDAEMQRIAEQLDAARATANTNYQRRWVEGTAPEAPEAIPVGLETGSNIIRNMDKELQAERLAFLNSIGKSGDYVPTPGGEARQAMRDALNEAVNAKAPKVRWNGKDYDYDEFRKLFSNTITWRETARKAVGAGDSAPRVRGGMTISGRPFANIGESTNTIGGALARPMIGFGERQLARAPKVSSLARLAWLINQHQPLDVDPTMSGVNLRGFGRD